MLFMHSDEQMVFMHSDEQIVNKCISTVFRLAINVVKRHEHLCHLHHHLWSSKLSYSVEVKKTFSRIFCLLFLVFISCTYFTQTRANKRGHYHTCK